MIEADLSRHRELAPLSVAPDVAFGVRSGLALALSYSRGSHAALGVGNGVCIRGSRETLERVEAACSDSATGLGAGVLAQVASHTVMRGGWIVRGPATTALELGTASSLARGRWWALAAPTVTIGLTSRANGNRERLLLAAYAGAHVGRGELHLRSGIEGTLATFGETFAIPIGVGASVNVRGVVVGVDASLDRALGPLNGMAWRTASMYVGTTFGAGR